jgi:hypothetical protein
VYIRHQSPDVDHRGRRVGIFGLVNTLSRDGLLTPEEEAFRRTNNDWYDAAYQDPSLVDAGIYRDNLLAAAWFKPAAGRLFTRIPGYLAILEAHGVACRRFASADPGRVLYEDADQIVVVPR